MPKLTKIRVLIVDDNDISRSIMRHILSENKYQVVGEAANGQLGIQLAMKLQPHIICLDIHMPDSSGLDVLKRVKEARPRIEVLMVTGNNDRESVAEAMQHGAAGYIVKPFNQVTLLHRMEQAVSRLQGSS